MSRALRKALSVGSSAAALTLALASCSDPISTAAPEAPEGPALSQSAAQDNDAVVPGEVLVSFKSGVDAGTKLRANGLLRKAVGYGDAFSIVSVNAGQERAIAAALKNDPDVEWAEPNYIRTVDADSRLWAFYNPGGLNMKFSDPTDSRYGTPIPDSYASVADADEDAIANIGAGGAVVTIGSIDTGVEYGHPEFTGRLIRGCDWYSMAAAGKSGACSDLTSDDTPEEGHGTHTTGTMAGEHVGVAGATGAAANVKVLVQRVCGEAGCYTSAIVNAINYAASYRDANGNPLVAINLSLGGRTESAGEKTAISNATKAGVLVIASAGNSGSGKVACPACDPNAISVAATDWKDALAAYSQYGSGLDIAAPGGYCYSNTTPEGCIYSAVSTGYAGGAKDGPTTGTYGWMNGTSMAAPQVTGAAAVVASKTGLRGASLRTRLESTADDKGTAGYDTKFGNGRLNVYRAVTNTAPPAGQ